MQAKLLACMAIILGFSTMSHGLSFVKTGTTSYNDRIIFDSVHAPDFIVKDAALANPDFYHNMYPTNNNPILSGRNIYAPDILTSNDRIFCYYGGWFNTSDGNDRIYLSVSDDLEPAGPWIYTSIIIDNGEYIHINDPSAVKVNANSYYMVYTTAFFEDGVYQERIDWAHSSNKYFWTPNSGSSNYRVNLTDPNNIVKDAVSTGKAITDYGRPSLLYETGDWIMYFDGQIDNDERAWTFQAVDSDGDANPDDFEVTHYLGKSGGWPYLLEADVYKHSNGKYHAVYRSNNWEIWQAESNDGIIWNNEVVRLKTNSIYWPYFHPNPATGGFSNPSWFFNENVQLMIGIAYGTTNNTSSATDHNIGFSYNLYKIQVKSPNGVWHVFGNSEKHWIFHLYTNGYTSFDEVRVIDPVVGQTLFTQDFSSARVGDVWKLIP